MMPGILLLQGGKGGEGGKDGSSKELSFTEGPRAAPTVLKLGHFCLAVPRLSGTYRLSLRLVPPRRGLARKSFDRV